jgi:hypothetical protein
MISRPRSSSKASEYGKDDSIILRDRRGGRTVGGCGILANACTESARELKREGSSSYSKQILKGVISAWRIGVNDNAPLIALFDPGSLIPHVGQLSACLRSTLRWGRIVQRSNTAPNASMKFSSSVFDWEGSGISSDARVESELREPLDEDDGPAGVGCVVRVFMCRRSVRSRGWGRSVTVSCSVRSASSRSRMRAHKCSIRS